MRQTVVRATTAARAVGEGFLVAYGVAALAAIAVSPRPVVAVVSSAVGLAVVVPSSWLLLRPATERRLHEIIARAEPLPPTFEIEEERATVRSYRRRLLPLFVLVLAVPAVCALSLGRDTAAPVATGILVVALPSLTQAKWFRNWEKEHRLSLFVKPGPLHWNRETSDCFTLPLNEPAR